MVTCGYIIVTTWMMMMMINPRSGCFIPGKVFVDICTMLGVLVRGSF